MNTHQNDSEDRHIHFTIARFVREIPPNHFSKTDFGADILNHGESSTSRFLRIFQKSSRNGAIWVFAIGINRLERCGVRPRLSHEEVNRFLTTSTAPASTLEACEFVLWDSVVDDCINIFDIQTLKSLSAVRCTSNYSSVPLKRPPWH